MEKPWNRKDQEVSRKEFTPSKNHGLMGFSLQQILIAMAIFVLAGGGAAFVAFQQYAVGLIHVHAPYVKDKDVIFKDLDKHGEELKILKQHYHKIDKNLFIIQKNQERILKKVD